jgi:uncharacterized protein YecE (DUF72 family)
LYNEAPKGAFMIFIGTSGYHYKHWKNKFYPKNLKESEWLEYYSAFFNTVELNVTFYSTPSEKAFKTWHHEVPENFKYAVKGSRYITHVKKLKDVEESVDFFFSRVKLLEEKLEIVLWQFPPNLNVNMERFELFLKELNKYKVKSAFEFRNESWFCEEVYNLLKKYNYALVIADSPSFPAHEVVTADYAYFRFHGGSVLYGSEYSGRELNKWTKKIKALSNVKDIYIYFNNDAFGFAIKNAGYLRSLLDK